MSISNDRRNNNSINNNNNNNKQQQSMISGPRETEPVKLSPEVSGGWASGLSRYFGLVNLFSTASTSVAPTTKGGGGGGDIKS